MNECKLDARLKALCQDHPEYTNLYSTWTLNKRTCTDMLRSVVIRYPHFSMHDASHAEAVVSKMEMLLGERIQNLSPTDIWLLLHAAYAHDLGMIVRWTEIKSVWEQPDFQSFLASLSTSADSEVRKAAQFLQQGSKTPDEPVWFLEAHRYVDLINAAYFRNKHAQLSNDYVHPFGTDFKLDLGHSGLIQSRIIKLLGQICAIHTEPNEKVLALDYQTDGIESDYAHPRFIAMMLRLGDLLDIDNGRFNSACELTFGGLPEASIPHKEKHNATTHLLVTPEKIQFRSDCPNSQAYLETRNFVSWLETELDFLTKYWSKIAPKDLGGYAPNFDKKELLIQGVPDVEGVAGLRFNISQEKAFQIIEGSNIYEDRFVFIREVIQNAMDASKLQLWKDLSSEVYHAWIGEKDAKKLQPYDLTEEIYKSYPVKVRLSTLENGMTQVEVVDRGTGISVDSFKRMCNVGTSNTGSKQIQEDIQAMPNWLRPTAGFGVGLQSIFLLTDQFEIETSTGDESFYAIVHSNRSGGYLQLQRTVTRPRGTTIRLSFQMPKSFSFAVNGDTQNYVELNLDPLASENHTGEMRILEAIRTTCGESIFPICISCAENSVNDQLVISQFPVCNPQIKDWPVWDNRYRFLINEDCTRVQLWDSQYAIYADFRLLSELYRGINLYFKGIGVKKGTISHWIKGLSVDVDIYGLDTKNTISLDRSQLTKQGRREVDRIFEELYRVYQACMLAHIEKKSSEQQIELCKRGSFSPYTFWLACEPIYRAKIPTTIIEQIEDTAEVLIRGEDGCFHLEKKLVRTLIPFNEETIFFNINRFDLHGSGLSTDYNRIISILDRATDFEKQSIIANRILTEATRAYFKKTLQIPVQGEPLLLYTVSNQERKLIKISNDLRNTWLRGLGDRIPELGYSRHLQEKRAKRYAIPAIEEYESLAVEWTPFGIAAPNGFHYHIISPFVREDIKKRSELSKSSFVEAIISAPTFLKLVSFVKEVSVFKDTVSESMIRDAYTQLIGDYYDATTGVECKSSEVIYVDLE